MKKNTQLSPETETLETSLKGTSYNLFPTQVKLFELTQDKLNAQLKTFFTSHPRFSRSDQAQTSDITSLMDHARDVPALNTLESLFIDCLKNYCKDIGWEGEFDLAMQMFPNVAPKGHYVPSHNHVSHISAVYYVHTDTSEKPLIVTDESARDYWRPENGALILHDPRFNASLQGGWQYHAKVFPKPGVMIFFPSFLWHEVTPHQSNDPRLSVAANFTLTYRNIPEYERHLKFSC